MASVFLSYDRDDSARARHFANALEKAGHQVWWDLHVRSGSQFAKVIEEALKAADVVVVLWSRFAIDSAWVRDEAGAGRDSGRLVPVTIDGTEPPLGFRQYQTIDLSQWKGRGSPVALRMLLADVEATAASGESPIESAPPAAANIGPAQRRVRTRTWVVGSSAAAAAIAAVALIFIRPWQAGGSVTPSVAIAAGDTSQLSQDMARTLLVKLGSQQTDAMPPVRLPDDLGPQRADIRLAVNGTRDGKLLRANLSLVSPRGKTMLWSRDFDRLATDRSALDEAIASAAGRALRCARDEASGEYGHLSEDLQRSYLSACTALTETFDVEPIIPPLRNITRKAPRFRPAWAALLDAEVGLLSSLGFYSEQAGSVRAALGKDVEAARKIDPDLAEATIAELALYPQISPGQAMALVDKAKAQDPQNPTVLVARAQQLEDVGRMVDALDEAEAAANFDPLSPVTQANLIFATLVAGKADRARVELAALKRVWPDNAVVKELEYNLELRTGTDFEKISREMGYVGPGFQIYLNARLHPSDATVAPYVAFMRKPENQSRMSFALQGLGEIDRPNEFYQLIADVGDGGAISRDPSILFRPWMAPIRRDPRFMVLVNRIGLVDYWRQSGRWPDFCAEADMPYDCKKEAAKLKA